MNIEVDVVKLWPEEKIAIIVKVPFDTYAGSLYPNETLRDAFIAALDRYMLERR